MRTESYLGIYPINLNFLIYPKEKIITSLVFESHLERFYKVFNKKVNFFTEDEYIRKLFKKKAWKYNKRVLKYREIMMDRIEEKLRSVKTHPALMKLFNSRKITTTIIEKEADGVVYDIIYIYSNGRQKLKVKDKLTLQPKYLEFFRKLEFNIYEGDDLIFSDRYIISRFKDSKGKLKINVNGNCSIVWYLYKIMRDKRVERNIFLTACRKG